MSFRIAANSPDYNPAGGAISNFDKAFGIEYDAAAGAIAIKEGTVFLTGSAAQAMTLALPIAGLQSAGGDDGRELTIIDVGGHAHTVTTPASGINAVDHIATFAGTVGKFGTFVAYNGVWYLAATAGITLS